MTVSGPKYASAVAPFAILALSILPFFLSNVYASVLAVKNTRRLNLQYLALFILNVLFNFILIPRWGVVGAAWSTVACEFLGIALGFWLASPYLGEMPWAKLFHPFVAALAASILMGLGIHLDPRLYWLALGPVVYGIGIYLFRGLDPEDWASLRSALHIQKA
jgi:O-antigen/teichoic acid export membrane protein